METIGTLQIQKHLTSNSTSTLFTKFPDPLSAENILHGFAVPQSLGNLVLLPKKPEQCARAAQ